MKINAINNQSGELTIDPGTAGADSFTQFDINGLGHFRIGVDGINDSFLISRSSAFGTNDTFEVTSSGEITKPLQPAFIAWAGLDDNVTGDGTTYTVAFDGEIIDQGGDYNTTTYTFTAPIVGAYRISYMEWIFNNTDGSGGLSSAYDRGHAQIVTSNRTYKGAVNSPFVKQNTQIPNGQHANFMRVMADMDSGDTVHATATISGGTKTVGVGGVSAGDTRGYFMGSLIC